MNEFLMGVDISHYTVQIIGKKCKKRIQKVKKNRVRQDFLCKFIKSLLKYILYLVRKYVFYSYYHDNNNN